MHIHGSIFMGDGDDLGIRPSTIDAAPILTLGTISIHLPDDAKLLELLDHITTYLAEDDSELDPAAAACREMGKWRTNNADLAG